MKYISKLLVLILLLLPVAALAEVKEIICEGTYNMGDGETPGVAESRALLQAKRIAIEQAGTYVESYSKVKNLQLTEDEIKIMASGIMEVTILDKKRTVVGDGFHFWVRIKALVNSDKMEEMAKKARDKASVEDYKKVQAAYDKSQKDIEELKKQLLSAKGDRRKDVEIRIADDEKRFQATQWYEKGTMLHAKAIWGKPEERKDDYNRALEAFTVAIAMDPGNGEAYAYRGSCYEQEKNYDKALADYQKAWSLCSGECQIKDSYGLIYALGNLGAIYHNELKDYYKAIEVFSIELPIWEKNGDAVYKSMNNVYLRRGTAYKATSQWEMAIKDYTKALQVGGNGPDVEKVIYGSRGFCYFKLRDKQNAISDFQKACELGSSGDCNNAKSLSKN